MLLGSAVPPPPAARESPVLSPLRMSSAEPLIPAPRPTPAAAVPVFVSAPAAAAARPAPELPAPAPTPGAGAKKPGGPTAASRWARKAAKASSKKGVRVLVSLPQQRAYVFKGGVLAFTAPVSTGKRGHPTPVGTFRILLKKVHHNSSKYDNAPMPYMQRLTNYGIALHAGHVPGYPASHGCIRLPRGYAKTLYGLTDSSTRVTITNRRPKSAKEALTIA
jgi:lipoprotein-anchoring transpeptidase ErfK/SrfK